MRSVRLWRRHKATSPSTNRPTRLDWRWWTWPLPDHGLHLLKPPSPPSLQMPDFAHQPLHTLCHMQRDLVTLRSNSQVHIQVATQVSDLEEQQSTVLGLPLADATAIVLPAVTSASFFCGKASLMPTSWEGPTTVHSLPITPGQKQRFSGWPRNRAWGFPSSPKAETAQQLQVKTRFFHLTYSPSGKI